MSPVAISTYVNYSNVIAEITCDGGMSTISLSNEKDDDGDERPIRTSAIYLLSPSQHSSVLFPHFPSASYHHITFSFFLTVRVHHLPFSLIFRIMLWSEIVCPSCDCHAKPTHHGRMSRSRAMAGVGHQELHVS